MRGALKIFIAGCVLILFARGAPVVAGETIVLDFWTTETTGERIAAIKYIVDVFEVMNDDVRVMVTAVNENEFYDRFVGACAQGDRPDMINAGSELVVALGGRGYLAQDAAREVTDTIGRSGIYGGALKMLGLGRGELYGMPFHGWVQCLWYRKDWFEEAGLDPPSDWNAILKAARHFNDPANGRYGILLGTKQDHYAEQVFTQIALSNGAAMIGGDGKLAFDSPRMVEALEYYTELAKYTPPGPQNWRARDYYLQGRLAMMFYSTFIMDDLALPQRARDSLTGANFADLEGEDFDPRLVSNTGMVSVLSGRRKSSYGVVSALGFVNVIDERRTEAAKRFARFLFDRQSYITWLHMAPGGMLPVVRGVAGDEDFMLDPGGVFRRYGREKLNTVLSGLERVENFSTGKGMFGSKAAMVFAEKIIPDMIYEATIDGVPPKAAVARASARMRRLLNE